MPVKKAAFKALRQSKRKANINLKVKSDIIALTRRINKAILAKDEAKAKDWLKQLIKKVDKATQNKVMKKNTAGRKKSRLTKAVNALSKK
ncbi:MAG: 30S ribosomal protein S20 [Candidatus Buchananbacteria bacterium]|nr:30S ribosomal protein S20 [Candidatus Buchananbacteria bacterium]